MANINTNTVTTAAQVVSLMSTEDKAKLIADIDAKLTALSELQAVRAALAGSEPEEEVQAPAPSPAQPVKRGRGRPKGSGKKSDKKEPKVKAAPKAPKAPKAAAKAPKVAPKKRPVAKEEAPAVPAKRGRGRPKGSKNQSGHTDKLMEVLSKSQEPMSPVALMAACSKKGHAMSASVLHSTLHSLLKQNRIAQTGQSREWVYSAV